MASAVIIRVCESCNETGEGLGGLRNRAGVLLCARCNMFADVVACVAFQLSSEEAQIGIGHLARKGIGTFISGRSSEYKVLYGDN